MNRLFRSLLAATPMSAVLLVLSTPGQANEPVLTEWQVPYPDSRPRDPDVDASGSVWFCGQAGEYLARFDPANASFEKFDLQDGANPHNLIIDRENRVWFAANTLPYIGRFDPDDGKLTKFAMPSDEVADPHTLVFDAHGDIWFTAQHGNGIGRLNVSSGRVDVVPIPISRSRPYGIKVDPDQKPWVVLFGTSKLAAVNPSDLSLELVDLPRREARPRRLEITADGAVWYGDYARGVLGRYRPRTGEFTEWPMPGGDSARPYGMALDDRDTLWIAEGSSPNRLVSFNTRTESFDRVIDVPHARGAIRHMVFHPRTRTLWFGEDTTYLGRLQLH